MTDLIHSTTVTTRSGRKVRPPRRFCPKDSVDAPLAVVDAVPSAAASVTVATTDASSTSCASTLSSTRRRLDKSLQQVHVQQHHDDSMDVGTDNHYFYPYKPNTRRRRTHRPPTQWLLPHDHPVKVLWDVLTVCLSLIHWYTTHTNIRDRQFGNRFDTFCYAWFVCDILFNFMCTRPVQDGRVLQDYRAVWARYLTTWFVIDALSLVPGELLYVKPIIEQQNKRGWLKKSVFRTRAVLRVTSVLRGRHFKLFGQVAKHTKRAGLCGANRLLRLIIKYVPKYLLFWRNMKGVVAVRVLRQVHWLRKVYNNKYKKMLYNDETEETDEYDDAFDEYGDAYEYDDDYDDDYDDEYDMESDSNNERGYWDWEFVDDEDEEDDGFPY